MKCKHERAILATREIDYAVIDEDSAALLAPESDTDVVQTWANIGVHVCADCGETLDVWIEWPRDKLADAVLAAAARGDAAALALAARAYRENAVKCQELAKAARPDD